MDFGSVSKYCHANAVRYVASNKDGVKRILDLINGKFYSDYKINNMKMYNFESIYNITLLPPCCPNEYPMDKNHFLADANACFDINITRGKLFH